MRAERAEAPKAVEPKPTRKEKPKPVRRKPTELERVEAEIAGREAEVAELERKLAEDWTDVDLLAAHRSAREELVRLMARWEKLFEADQAMA